MKINANLDTLEMSVEAGKPRDIVRKENIVGKDTPLPFPALLQTLSRDKREEPVAHRVRLLATVKLQTLVKLQAVDKPSTEDVLLTNPSTSLF